MKVNWKKFEQCLEEAFHKGAFYGELRIMGKDYQAYEARILPDLLAKAKERILEPKLNELEVLL